MGTYHSLDTVNVKAIIPPALGYCVFNGCDALSNIYVPADSVNAYEIATNWSDYADIIEAMLKVTFIMNDHGTQVPVQNVAIGDKVIKPENPTADGWEFAGWFTDEKCTDGNEYDFSTPVTENKTLYAKWNEKVSPEPEPDTPKTGDSNNMLLWSLLLALSIIGLGIGGYFKSLYREE